MINILYSAIFFHIYVSFGRLHTIIKFNVSKIYCKSIIRKKTVPHQYEDTNYCLDDWRSFFEREAGVLPLFLLNSCDFADLFFLSSCLSPVLCSSPVPHPPLEVGLKEWNYYKHLWYLHFHDISEQKQFNSILSMSTSDKCTRPFVEVNFQL